MVGDKPTIDSGYGSFDTSATLKTDCLSRQSITFNGFIDGTSTSHSNSSHHVPGTSGTARLSLEAMRQDEIKKHAIVNALNQFILQAGNICKGNKHALGQTAPISRNTTASPCAIATHL